jgi:hypothetical protein
MTTIVDICNLALSAIGNRSTITALAEDSPEARACNLWYSPTLTAMLRQTNWNFARETRVLARTKALPGTPENTASVVSYTWASTLPAPPYKYEYIYPTDAARIRFIWPVGEPIPPASYDQYYSTIRPPVPFEVAIGSGETKVILTNERNAIAIITEFVAAPDNWGASFQLALISELAYRIAPALTGDKELVAMMKNQAIMDLREAQVSDANEDLTVAIHPVPDWMLARDG